MTTLVLCIDRDNDFGEKVGAASPVIGRENNLKLATAMGIADPEESDTNALFGAVNIFDQLKSEDVECEIVTICGARKVGVGSDQSITRQLDDVIGKIGAKDCVFVSDGAEDEFVLPLVTSRLKVTAVRRIIVKQNADIEGTFYVVKKALEDDKVRRTFVIPVALAFVVYGAFALAGQADKGIGAITLTIGVYFIMKSLHLFATTKNAVTGFVEGVLAGRIVTYTLALAALVVVNGVFTTFAALAYAGDALVYGVNFALHMVWWVVLAFIITLCGRVIDSLLRDEPLARYWMLPFAAIASGLIGSAGLALIQRYLAGGGIGLRTIEFVEIIVGLLLVVVGAASHTYVRGQSGQEDAATQAAKQPSKG